MTIRHMQDWALIFSAFGALDAVSELTGDRRPAWVFSRDGRTVLWANPAGGALFGVRRFADMAGTAAPHADVFARQLANVAGSLGEAGSLARLRLTAGARAVPLLCQCRLVRAADGRRGILVIAMDAPARLVAISDKQAAAFATGIGPAAASAADSKLGAAAAGRPEDEAPPAGATGVASAVEVARPPADEAPAVPSAETAGDGQSLSMPSQDHEPERFSRALLADDEASPQSPDEAAAMPESGRQAADRPASPPLSTRKPVRFLWQTDAADRFLFVSPGLGQLVGRTSEVVGETWHDIARRLKLDPDGRIAEALGRHDTWSGLTAWWPVEGSDYRIPAELTALPVFGIDQSFQGFRGFGVLKPGDVVTPDMFRRRYGGVDGEAAPQPPIDAAPPEPGGPQSVGQDEVDAADEVAGNVVPLRAVKGDLADFATLSPDEESAFDEIASALASDAETPDDEASDVVAGDAAATPPGDDGVAPDQAPEPADTAPPPRQLTVPQSEALADNDSAAVISLPDEAGDDGGADARSLAGRLADAEARIRELTSILDTATDGVVVIDEDGCIASVNASGEALFGEEQAELLGRPLADLFDGASRQQAIDYLSGLKENGVASVLNEGREVVARAGDGTIPLFITMGRIGSAENGRFCAVLRDLTHWKQAEAELIAARRNAEAASNQKSDFLARVSHEIRTPLNAIIGFSEVMIEERFGPIENERYREYLRDMRTSGEHVVSLVNDLLDISKIEAGKLDLQFDAVPLNPLVRECITLMQPQANRAHVILRSSLSPDVPSVVADQRTLRQVVLNLLSNSVKFTGPGGQVIASTAIMKNGEAVLKVRDTGEGMTEDEVARALEPFRQLTTASLRDGDGTGLGLPLTKALVEANRADFSIRSAPGEGTIVTVAFPQTRVLSE